MLCLFCGTDISISCFLFPEAGNGIKKSFDLFDLHDNRQRFVCLDRGKIGKRIVRDRSFPQQVTEKRAERRQFTLNAAFAAVSVIELQNKAPRLIPVNGIEIIELRIIHDQSAEFGDVGGVSTYRML